MVFLFQIRRQTLVFRLVGRLELPVIKKDNRGMTHWIKSVQSVGTGRLYRFELKKVQYESSDRKGRYRIICVSRSRSLPSVP